MDEQRDPTSEEATAELEAIPGALERAREGSAQLRRVEGIELDELVDQPEG